MPDLRSAIADLFNEEKDGTTALQAIIRTLFKRALNGDVRAAQELLDRGFGKSQQYIDHTTQGDKLTSFTYEIIKSEQPKD